VVELIDIGRIQAVVVDNSIQVHPLVVEVAEQGNIVEEVVLGSPHRLVALVGVEQRQLVGDVAL